MASTKTYTWFLKASITEFNKTISHKQITLSAYYK